MSTRPVDKNNRPRAADPARPAAPSAFPWPPLLFLGGIAIAVLAPFQLPSPWLGRPLSDILFAVGWLGVVAVIFIYVGAIRALKRAKTTLRPDRPASHLVTSGPFAVSRNPLYLANTLLMLALSFITGNLWFIPMAIIAAFATSKLAIEPEERHLESRFGKHYRDYRKKVRRWI